MNPIYLRAMTVVAPGLMLDNFLPILYAESLPFYPLVLKLVVCEILKRHHSIAYKGLRIVLEWEISRIVGHENDPKINHGNFCLASGPNFKSAFGNCKR